MTGPSANAYGGTGPLILGITWTETILATIAVILRAYSAGRLVKKAEWDLFWVIVAWVGSLAAQVMLTVAVAFGDGNHIENLTPNDIVESQKWGWFGQIVAIFTIGFGKMAVIALLLRLQGPTHHKKRYILHFVWITNTILNISQTVLILLACTPVQKVWNDFVPGDCSFRHTTSQAGFLQGSWAAASDVVLASYPIFVFWPLNLSLKRKIGLCALMGGGYVAAIAGIMKTIYIELITATADITHAIHPLLIWAFTEMWLIIILGSIPQLRIVITLLKDKVSVHGSSSENTVRSDSKPGFHDHINDMRAPGFGRDPFRDRFADSTIGDTTQTGTTIALTEDTERNNDSRRMSHIMVTSSYTVTYEDEAPGSPKSLHKDGDEKDVT